MEDLTKKEIKKRNKKKMKKARKKLVRRRKSFLIFNEQHSLFENQEQLLKEEIGDFERIDVPASGWTLAEMEEIIEKIEKIKEEENVLNIIMGSPIPYLIKILARKKDIFLFSFHNDRREKKEVPTKDGGTKIINTVSKKGWELV